ncbi:bifunctional (p)ppGpp synthetase/guanosine-3',5'-bis(diphosphate) 3'-pyrophosphohydrolase [Gorillibacterium massiliense]|uniref:bifunctional (p)ppGpp synthetase/guanosine-3',5'-bis(diphosphate) 3'-pyrophosphohydrolase n=1 Tax=Gorillibacterium massiliense TaxID=1280390 RepID=UPI0004B9BE79|nr:bifunctional (p)ppGpp synthetase/guanosine-3',5'-bis(diphosphate) 3'-pyrophosphohydrolase [Gorillibacterium massiliense]
MAGLTRAIVLAAKYHDGQKDGHRGNQPYLFHPLRLMMNALSEEEQIIAVLHDTIEETELTLDKLREEGFSEKIVEAIDTLSRRKKESYEEFIRRIKQNALARRVKILDLQDNMAALRMKKRNDKEKERLKKYSNALDVLLGYSDSAAVSAPADAELAVPSAEEEAAAGKVTA